MDEPLETSPPPAEPARPQLPVVTYFLCVAVLYAFVGGVAQFYFLPLGIWWSQILFFIVPTVLLLHAMGFRAGRFLRFDRLPARRQRLLVLAVSVAVFFSASALMAACEGIAPRSWVDRFDMSKILDSVHGPWQVVLFASVVIGAPVAEETVFRGYLLPVMRQNLGLGSALVVQAILFSAIHADPIGFVPRLLLGLVFGYLVTLTGSLWSSILAHSLNNSVSTVLFFLYGPGRDSEVAPDSPVEALLLSLGMGLVVFALLWWLRAVTPTEPPSPVEDPEARAASVPGLARSLRSAFVWGLSVALTLAAFAVASQFLPKA